VDVDHVHGLESSCHSISVEHENEWRLKSRALWLDIGVLNTKFFQCCANYRKIYKTIWYLLGDEGTKVHGFIDLAMLGVCHFQTLF